MRGGLFDGGRVIPAGEDESFEVRASAHAAIVLRSDDAIDAIATVGGETRPLVAARASAWTTATSAPLDVAPGDRVTIHARAPLRDFHVWIVTR